MDLVILAAEPSADVQGANLIRELLREKPDLQIAAIAGPRMRELPITPIGQMETFQVMGFWDVFLALPRLIQQFKSIQNELLKLSPKAIICIDYPGLHLRLQKALRKRGYRGQLIQYICPSVWAWGKKRIGKMEKTLDLLLCIFPFEKELFHANRLEVAYVGHPLAGEIAHYNHAKNFRETYQLKEGPILGLFPGSRKSEIEQNLPLQLEVAKQLCLLNPKLQVAISVASKDREAQVWSLAGLKAICIPAEHTYELMKHCYAAIATSGTVTLELALHEVPTVVTYAIRPFDFFVAKHLLRIKLPFYCIVNIIAKEPIYPELFGPQLTFQTVYDATLQMLRDSASRTTCQKGCRKVKEQLGEHLAASSIAAKKVIDLFG